MSGVRCISKQMKLTVAVLTGCVLCSGCRSVSYDIPYDIDTSISAFRFESSDTDKTAEAFASDLCVVTGEETPGEEIESGSDSYGSAALFDVSNKEVLYSKNATAKLYPASMTKVMTALLAMKYGNMEDVLTASENVLITESGAQLCGFKPGDTMTLDQALHGLLMYSGNDAAIMIAEHISGSVEEFSNLMNAEAAKLGATNTHFVNPNGLHDENHYSTAYDMYLIFNEAIQYPLFNEIIHMDTYTTNYKNSAGEIVNITFNSTNRYLKGDVTPPTKVTVIGGKTGTTNAAGANLILLVRDSAGNPYISVVMKAQDTDTLYLKMNSLLKDVD